MNGPIVSVERYGKRVWENAEMDKVRRQECMCLFCAKLNISEPDKSCNIAKEYFQLCKKYGNAFIMTRCCDWAPKDGNDGIE